MKKRIESIKWCESQGKRFCGCVNILGGLLWHCRKKNTLLDMPIVDEMLLGNFYLCSKKNTEVTKGLI